MYLIVDIIRVYDYDRYNVDPKLKHKYINIMSTF